jgi:hypothetical protein
VIEKKRKKMEIHRKEKKDVNKIKGERERKADTRIQFLLLKYRIPEFFLRNYISGM